jgi:hypothetical protein
MQEQSLYQLMVSLAESSGPLGTDIVGSLDRQAELDTVRVATTLMSDQLNQSIIDHRNPLNGDAEEDEEETEDDEEENEADKAYYSVLPITPAVVEQYNKIAELLDNFSGKERPLSNCCTKLHIQDSTKPHLPLTNSAYLLFIEHTYPLEIKAIISDEMVWFSVTTGEEKPKN